MVITEKKQKLTTEVKRLLAVVWVANKEIERININREKTRSRAERVTTSYSDVPGGGHNPASRSDAYDRLVDLDREQHAAICKWCDAIAEVQVILSWVDDPKEKLVLEYRYINCEDWLTISFRLNYSVQYLYHLHGIALYKLAMKLKKTRGNES